VVLVPPGEIFTAFDSGVIDAAEWVGPWNDMAFGLHRLASYYYQPGVLETGPALELSVNRAAYDALPADLQALVATVAKASAAESTADFLYNNIASLKPLLEEHGVQLRMWPEEVAGAMREMSEQVLAEYASIDAMTEKVNASYVAYRDRAIEWSRWSDQAMLNMRNG
jgi:TRAP-type mannitol/chloroaromatic compound transport system substrate-binding protein